MVPKGRELSPLKLCSAVASSAVLTVFSMNGTPLLTSSERADPQGPQFSLVYRVTGYLDATCRSANGNEIVATSPPKAVLPALCPDLNYDKLDGVQNGGMAMDAFFEALAPETSATRKAEIKSQLLAYCALDTNAMVRIWADFTGKELN